jgi:hypothetical protein
MWINAIGRRPWLGVPLGLAFLGAFFFYLGPVREREDREHAAEAARWEHVSRHGQVMTPEMLIPPPGTDPLVVEQQRMVQMHPDYAGEVDRWFVFGVLWSFAFAGAWLLLLSALKVLSRHWPKQSWADEYRKRGL